MLSKETIERVKLSIDEHAEVLISSAIQDRPAMATCNTYSYTVPHVVYAHLLFIKALNFLDINSDEYLRTLTNFRNFCDRERNALAEAYGKTSGPL